jgi:hypothetical protein
MIAGEARRMLQRSSLLFVLLLASSSIAFCQADQPQQQFPNAPQVTFELTWRAADPQWFQVAIDSTGRASYQSQAHTEPNETPGDPYMLKFTATETLRNQIFALAKELNYFRDDLSYKGSQRIADTGDKTLSYTAEGKTSKASFNYSPSHKADELSAIFQQLSNTFEIGRKLDYALRFDKLGIDAQLKLLESLQRSGSLRGLQVLVPSLERVVNDPATMNISRQRANYLIHQAKLEK